MNFSQFLNQSIVCFDGGMGTLLQRQGLTPGEHPERWNLSHPEVITQIHRDYFDAGSHVVTTNTFGANLLKFDACELQQIICAAVANAKNAKEQSQGTQQKFIALDIGPSGKLLKPLGDLDFEDAVELFAQTVRIGVACGVDLILIETMNDSYETKAALLAAKETCDLPVVVTNAYGADGKLMTGATPAAMVAMLEGMGAAAIGANCSLGPKQLTPVVRELLENASVPVLLQPNAGLPKVVDGQTLYDVTAEEFAEEVCALVQQGVRMVGGCCGTTPAYIKELHTRIQNISPVPLTEKNITAVSSYTHAVIFGDTPVLIGERINPTGKKRFKQALLENDLDYILSEGVRQQENGAHILDVNVGLPDIDEVELLKNTVCQLQTVTDLPLQIDTANLVAMEASLRRYNGKAMINSVNGKQESMQAVFPLVKKYGGVVVALTLDENGIPSTADGRFAIAQKILATAAQYGIDKKDIVFDPLAMAVSADHTAALATLESLRRIRSQLGCHTSLGVSNVSFGLPDRDTVNSIFFAMALEHGLSAAIMNPNGAQMMKTYHAYKALRGLDPNCPEYIAAAQSLACIAPTAPTVSAQPKAAEDFASELQRAVVKGFKDKAAELTQQLLTQIPALEIVDREIIPALNTVGLGFEQNKIYLPQLLMSAEAAKSAFGVIKAGLSDGQKTADKGVFVLATVQGDIHDIGKNIVKLLLENYGFTVVDLGKDVPPQVVVDKVVSLHAPLVGLSALMTTTVPAMQETVQLLRQQAPWCTSIVGGAVLTQEYADRIGAHYYAKDAMQTVRYAESVISARK